MSIGDRPYPALTPLPSGLVLRAVEPGDVEQLAELLNQPRFRWGTMRLPHTSVADTRKRFELDSLQLSIVAVLDGRIVGQAGLRRMTGRQVHVAEVGMGVHDDFQGRGFGSALMAEVVEAADRWLDIRRLQLSVYADNAPAIALYRKFGFEEEGLFRAYAFRDGAYVDALAMARLRRI